MTAAAFLNKVSPFGNYETRHLLNGLVGVVGIVGTWKLGRVLGGPRAGFLAALFLALTPNYYGQMFNNPKDIPFAADRSGRFTNGAARARSAAAAARGWSPSSASPAA